MQYSIMSDVLTALEQSNAHHAELYVNSLTTTLQSAVSSVLSTCMNDGSTSSEDKDYETELVIDLFNTLEDISKSIDTVVSVVIKPKLVLILESPSRSLRIEFSSDGMCSKNFFKHGLYDLRQLPYLYKNAVLKLVFQSTSIPALQVPVVNKKVAVVEEPTENKPATNSILKNILNTTTSYVSDAEKAGAPVNEHPIDDDVTNILAQATSVINPDQERADAEKERERQHQVMEELKASMNLDNNFDDAFDEE